MSINGIFRMSVVAVVAALVIPAPVTAVEEIESSLARGGRLYDKWYKVIDVKTPKKSHALYRSPRAHLA